MSSVGNKGKFSDRLKRMKLIRYAKKMNIKIKDGFLLKDMDNDDFDKINISVDNKKVVIINYKDGNSLLKDIVDKNKTSDFLKRKAVETASVGAAVVGIVGVNLLNNNSQIRKDNINGNTNQNVDNNKINSSSDDISINNLKNDINTINNTFQMKRDNIESDKIKEKDDSIYRGKDNTRNFIKNKAVETAGVAVSMVGILGSNLLNNNLSRKNKFNNKNISKLDNKSYLSAQIIKKIKKEFESNLNEIEVLESELYLLNYKNENELDLERCREIRKEITQLIIKINHIIDQYNIYNHNRFLDDMLDIDESTLVDDISDFKRLYDGNEIKDRLKEDYELIIEYQLLYGKLDDIKKNVENVRERNNNKIIDYDKRDKRYNIIKNNIVNIEEFQRNCEYYIKKQNEYIDDINKRVSNIDIDYITHYKLRGFGNLISGTLRYLGMLVVSPFSSFLPGIGYKTYVAGNMVNNLRKSLKLEKVTTTIYKAENFQFELNDKINNLDYNYYNVDKTLDDIKKLKSEFMEQYNYDIPGYDKTLRDINEIEKLIYNNREKLDLIRGRLIDNRKINEDTLKKVRVLEKESKPYIES